MGKTVEMKVVEGTNEVAKQTAQPNLFARGIFWVRQHRKFVIGGIISAGAGAVTYGLCKVLRSKAEENEDGTEIEDEVVIEENDEE